MQYVRRLLDTHRPTSLFTIGGGDDVEILPISYINEQFDGKLSVLFFDAHGDLNTPETSPSQKLHGMPLRTLLGDGDDGIVDLLYRPLLPQQVLMVGTRDCDAAEYRYIAEKKLQVIPSGEANSRTESVLAALRAMNAQNVYVHIDIDVLDPLQFPYQPVPAPNGMNIDALSHILKCVQKEFRIAGMCLLGCCSTGTDRIGTLQEIIHMGSNLD